jgi:hypothetical protein
MSEAGAGAAEGSGRFVVSDSEACKVTLATLHSLVESTLARPAGNDHSRGYLQAMRDVKAVLDKHGAPPDEPVHFGAFS